MAAITTLFMDGEVRLVGPVSLGPHRAIAPGSQLFCLAYQVGEAGTPAIWRFDEPVPFVLQSALENPEIQIVSHNAVFEWVLIQRLLPGCPAIALERLNCTSARAAAVNCPASQDGALQALGAPEAFWKDAAGSEAMLDFCVGTLTSRNSRKGPCLEPGDHPERFDEMLRYCLQDLRGLVWLHQNLPELTPTERAVWVANAEINDRGLLVDQVLAKRIVELGEENQKLAEAEFVRIAGVPPRSPKRVREWFVNQLPAAHPTADLPAGMAKDTFGVWRKALTGNAEALRALELKEAAATSPGAKVATVLEQACEDGRARDLFRYCATVTGRFASGGDGDGAAANVQNLARGTLPPEVVEACVDSLVSGTDLDWVHFLSGNARAALGQMQRAIFIPPPGKKLAIVDYSGIEAVVAATIAGHEELVRMLRESAPLYEITAAGIFNVPVDQVTKAQRLVGKTAVLSCQYGAGKHRFLEALKAKEVPGADIHLAERAVTGWRRQNLPIVALWYSLSNAYGMAATGAPPQVVADGWGVFRKEGEHVCLQLASGRTVWFRHASATRRFDGAWDLSYTRPKNGQLLKTSLHGGLMLENLASALSRDILAAALIKARAEGFKAVLHCHDELVAEVDAATADAEFARLSALMEDLPKWASSRGLVLGTAGEIVNRYTK
jgi:DNA polymerase